MLQQVIEHVRDQVLGTKVGTGSNGARNLLDAAQAYVMVLSLAADLEFKQSQLNLQMASFADNNVGPDVPPEPEKPTRLEVVR